MKPGTGELVIISSSRQSLYELITRFYSHQRTYELYTAETVTATLEKLGIKYKVEHETTSIDLAQQFSEGFSSEKASRYDLGSLCVYKANIILLKLPSCV